MPTLPIRVPRRNLRRGPAVGERPADPRAAEAAVVDCAVYRDGRRLAGSPTWSQALSAVRERGSGFVWIGLHEPTERQLAPIADAFELHPLAVEDAVHAHQRPKLDRYDESMFAVVKTVHYDSAGHSAATEVVETGELMIFIGKDFVITVRHGEHGGLRGMRMRLEADSGQLCLGPSAVLHAILDQAVDGYLAVAAELQTDIDEAETSVFAGASRYADANRLYLLKREVLALKRATAPLSAPLTMLAERPMRLVHDDVREYFRDVDDHLTQVVDLVAGFDDLLTTLVQANLAQVSVVQNEDMRKISAWVGIVSVPTLVAGVYGMNFDHMPELHWTFGYPLVVGCTLGVCLTLHRTFKRNGWL
ncbi:MAG: magnesium and cobalt transport protein CorA [Jatrophihabitantaceae bacterium]